MYVSIVFLTNSKAVIQLKSGRTSNKLRRRIVSKGNEFTALANKAVELRLYLRRGTSALFLARDYAFIVAIVSQSGDGLVFVSKSFDLCKLFK